MLHPISRLVRAATGALVLAALAGCGDSGTGSQAGTLTVKLTDAPGDFRRAVVTISQVYLKGSADDASANGRVVLLNTPTTVDLLTLANATADLVKDATVPAGTYATLAFVITGGYVEVETSSGSQIYATANYDHLPAGATVAGTLQMPSFAQSGLKVTLPGGSVKVEGDQRVLLVDFDVAQSFGHDAGNSGKWVMHPVVHATDFAVSGGATVTLAAGAGVTLPTLGTGAVTLGQFSATLTNSAGSTETVPLTDANADGVFEAQFRFLLPGSYMVDFTAPAGVTFTTTPGRPAALTVTGGAQATSAFTLTSATGS